MSVFDILITCHGKDNMDLEKAKRKRQFSSLWVSFVVGPPLNANTGLGEWRPGKYMLGYIDEWKQTYKILTKK